MYHSLRYLLILCLWAALASACQNSTPASNSGLPAEISYNFHVRPILSDKCFACHGPDAGKREANLRLDVEEVAKGPLPENPSLRALVAGKTSRSEAIHRIFSDDPEELMPPPDANLALTEQEKAILQAWVEQGAKYEPHWAFQVPQKAALPEIGDEFVPKNEIDHFIHQARKREGLTASPAADKASLLRRLSFGLTGLPPTLGEVDAFEENESTDAYEQQIDRLLASPAYGERMAADWLDVARYADSDGYLDDKHRDFSPWRDWVIQAFNRNLPYDEFVSWQLAGDLLPKPTQEQVLATAFNRLHKKNSEAGIVFEEYRVEYVSDRTHTLGKAMMGLSIECARCHDHKYDPVSQEEYYQLFAFFNQTDELGHAVYGPDQTPGPALLLTDAETEGQLRGLEKIIREQEAKLSKQADSLTQATVFPVLSLAALDQQLGDQLAAHYDFDQVKAGKNESAQALDISGNQAPAKLNRPEFQPGPKGQAFQVSDYNSGSLPEKLGWFERTDPFSFDLWVYPDTTYEDAGILFHCENRRLGLKGYSLHLQDNRVQFILAHSYPQNAIEVQSQHPLPAKKWSHLTVVYDGSSRAEGVGMFVNGEKIPTRTERDHLYKGILYEPDIHTYGFSGLGFGQRGKIKAFKNGRIDELKIFTTALTDLEVQHLHDPKRTSQLIASSSPLIQTHQLARQAPTLAGIRTSLSQHREQLNEHMNQIPEIMVMGDREEKRPTHVLNRGSYADPLQEVQPGTPEAVLPFPEEFPKNRLGLAQWLFLPENPLTARVMVNRVWQMHFGTGLVKSSDDFGNQGDLPTHPELLDWLAVRFQESGWDLKALHKLILMSGTYQQSSVMRKDLLTQDPDNRWLARGPQQRMTAEMVRDHALASSGLLVSKQGGPSAYPYQPAGLWDELTNKSWRYPYLQEAGEGLYRRSLYSIWKRTSPPPALQIFDIADRDVCTVKRQATSTPLQALVLLNDPQFVEAARVMAIRLLQEENSTETRLQQAFRLTCGRLPLAGELALIQAFFEQEQQHFQAQPQQAETYLSVGEMPVPAGIPAAELAALSVTVNNLFNTSEGITIR